MTEVTPGIGKGRRLRTPPAAGRGSARRSESADGAERPSSPVDRDPPANTEKSAQPSSANGKARNGESDYASAAVTRAANGSNLRLPADGFPIGHDPSVAQSARKDDRASSILQGRIEKISHTEIEGWAWDSHSPDKHIRLQLIEGSNRLSEVVADRFRSDLVQLGCGDGRHGFSIALDDGLLSEGRHILSLKCADTGATLPGSPIVADRQRAVEPAYHIEPTPVAREEGTRWSAPQVGQSTRELSKYGHVDAGQPILLHSPEALEGSGADLLLLKSTKSSAALRSVLERVRAGKPARYTISRNDLARYRQLERFGQKETPTSVLTVTDVVHATGTLPSRFLTDCATAAWLRRDDLQHRFPRLDEEASQYAFLAWYLCVRPIEEGLALSREPIGPTLEAMSETVIGRHAESGTNCNALMLAAYCYVATYDGSTLPAPAECRAGDVVPWFICDGAYYLRISHAIPHNTRLDLAATRCGSPILRWTAERIAGVASADFAMVEGPDGILNWLGAHDHESASARCLDLLRESMIVRGGTPFDGPSEPVLPPACRRLRDVLQDITEFSVTDGRPEYMCAGGEGDRLLLKDEWYPAEPSYVWSRAPVSTLLFSLDAHAVEWFRIGLLFDCSPLPERRMAVYLNHNRLWSGTIRDASSSELILACTGRCLAIQAVNLLQILIEQAFVPAEHQYSSDQRRLGVGVKRFWIQRAGGYV